ncbi:porin family protein [Pedobacter nototheniae]|uniref:porin family protein n=1 Tax=Pedobacter nototheniae TaxID=2488994 RepID=UPI002930CF1D|nr:porin family protein [Pedobacter nototheniae]
MKRIISALSLMLFTFTITLSQTRTTLKAGVTFPAISSNQSQDLQDVPNAVDYSMSTSFYIGATLDIPISNSFYFQTGGLFIGKGGKNEFYGNTEKIKTYYVEVPLNFLFKFPVGKQHVFLGAGPYFAMAVTGKNKLTNSSGQAYNTNITFGERFKRADAGLSFISGLECSKHLTLNVGYSIGLLNIRGQGADYIFDRNKVLSAGLGYRIK